MADNLRERTPLTAALARVVTDAREEAGISQRAMSRLSGLNYATLRRLEDHNRTIDFAQLGRIADVLGVSVLDLIAEAERRLEAAQNGNN